MSDDAIAGCAPHRHSTPFPALNDPEGERVPDGVEVIDGHVHLFPPKLFEAIWRWFDTHAWPIRYRLHAESVVAFLASRGVKRFVGLAYSHTPGLARLLNRNMAELSRAHPEIIPLATVLPGEVDAREVLHEAFGTLGLRGVKLHCHVQRMAADDPRVEAVYAQCEDAGLPVVIHTGREPSFPAYGVDTRTLTAAAQVERVLQRHPRLVMVVPHLGADEFDAYAALLTRYENLWLDTTMAIGEYFPYGPSGAIFPGLASRLLYGTDFPNLPYAWDRELTRTLRDVTDADARRAVLHDNAVRVFGG